jgi:hypothetical protein
MSGQEQSVDEQEFTKPLKYIPVQRCSCQSRVAKAEAISGFMPPLFNFSSASSSLPTHFLYQPRTIPEVDLASGHLLRLFPFAVH